MRRLAQVSGHPLVVNQLTGEEAFQKTFPPPIVEAPILMHENIRGGLSAMLYGEIQKLWRRGFV